MPDDVRVGVEGLAALRRGLRQIEPELAKELGARLREVADDVAEDARSRVPSVSGTARRSIRAGVSGARAYIQGGKRTVPYYGWLDFGARTPRKGNPRTLGPWRGSGQGPDGGRFIYPAIAANRSDIEVRAAQVVNDIAEKALP